MFRRVHFLNLSFCYCVRFCNPISQVAVLCGHIAVVDSRCTPVIEPVAQRSAMADNDLLDYEDEDDQDQTAGDVIPEVKKPTGGYVSIHSSGFRDFLLKPELLRAIVDCGFEHPSEVQHECIPQAILGMDILCQAKSGMGKTAVFVLATLQQLDPIEGQVSVLVMCHTRELAFQISKEYERFSKYLPSVRVGVFFGGMNITNDEKVLKSSCPHVVVGTPGRVLALVRSRKLQLKHIKHFVLDECDKMLEQLGWLSMIHMKGHPHLGLTCIRRRNCSARQSRTKLLNSSITTPKPMWEVCPRVIHDQS
ncbi:hypothetical protein V5799_030028 [Amblyomma americanum]|uniref:RNA helicase n=1 Tax=Amblyomma americanum TaxID=6943 RepID=A0AAQ4EPG4_AMBAM